MSANTRRLLPIAAVTLIAAGAQLNPATARAELHNITYRARIDGVTTGSQATFVIKGGQTNTAGLGRCRATLSKPTRCCPTRKKPACAIVVHCPYSANVHCEIDVDDNVFVQVDQMVRPVPGNADPNERRAAVRRTACPSRASGLSSPSQSAHSHARR